MEEEIKETAWEWDLKITRVMNGYLLEGANDRGDPCKSVIEDGPGELDSHEKLLWEVMNYFNFGGSKHDPERLKIIREKGESDTGAML